MTVGGPQRWVAAAGGSCSSSSSSSSRRMQELHNEYAWQREGPRRSVRDGESGLWREIDSHHEPAAAPVSAIEATMAETNQTSERAIDREWRGGRCSC
jgi:hypothetical protein